uniref:Uncharacterized protein n=1 Tax=Arundo donax TaxID=35708 RepID=A0A0A9GGH6_ARUDO
MCSSGPSDPTLAFVPYPGESGLKRPFFLDVGEVSFSLIQDGLSKGLGVEDRLISLGVLTLTESVSEKSCKKSFPGVKN